MVIKKYGLYFAWLIATCGTLLSLYFSDVKNMEPCNLCWYQRICLFPMIIILAIATCRGYLGIALYLIPQTALGLLFALYQVAIQEIPDGTPSTCVAPALAVQKNINRTRPYHHSHAFRGWVSPPNSSLNIDWDRRS